MCKTVFSLFVCVAGVRGFNYVKLAETLAADDAAFVKGPFGVEELKGPYAFPVPRIAALTAGKVSAPGGVLPDASLDFPASSLTSDTGVYHSSSNTSGYKRSSEGAGVDLKTVSCDGANGVGIGISLVLTLGLVIIGCFIRRLLHHCKERRNS